MRRLRAYLASLLLVAGIGCGDDSESSATSDTSGTTGDGDGDTGDGDGDTGDGDGDTGDGDTGDGDGDGDGDTGDGDTGDGDGDTGDGDGDGDTGDGDGDGDGDTGDGDGDGDCNIMIDPNQSLTFQFTDTPEDDIATDALKLFFEGLPELCESDYMFFQILGDEFDEGAWCSARGDWYVTTYLDVYGQSPTLMTGPFQMWYRDGDENAPWEESLPFGQQNHYGGGCAGEGAWCSNWGIGGKVFLGVVPESIEQLSPGSELRLVSSFTDGANWEMTLTWGRSREAACGF